jgi:ribosomal protein S4E
LKSKKGSQIPTGFMDVISLLKTQTHYRLLYDFKGRFGLAKISASEAEFKLCKGKRRVIRDSLMLLLMMEELFVSLILLLRLMILSNLI